MLLSTALTAAVLTVISLPAEAQPAPNARPTGGQVVAGSASITQAPTTTTVTQSTSRAAVNWQSFDVGSQQSVEFKQPNAASVTLNRVTGPDPSAIAGQIHANGQVILTNPSGVVFYQGAQVNAQSLIVSAPGITNQNFMAGRMVFDQAAHPNATVANAGTITVQQTGLAALVAPRVANSGVISAKLGHAVLAGAEAATLDMYGDGLVAVDVTKQVTTAPGGKQALVTNSGTIVADGGQILLTAAAVDGVVSRLVDAGGRIRANSLGAKTGSIAINGTGGGIVISGSLAAMGNGAGSTGGTVELNADHAVVLTPHAVVDASGHAGGGTVAIGTTLPRAIGGPSVTPTMTAARTRIATGAQVRANATGSGNGGRVTVLSTQSTALHGTITARGGSLSGNGGTVEVSTGGVLSLDGAVDLSAPHGKLGFILLDPGTLDITSTPTGTALTPGATDPNISFSQGGSLGVSYVTPAELAALNGNIQLQAVTDINVLSAVNLTGTGQRVNLATTGQSLELDAGRNITVRAPITTHGSISLFAGAGTYGNTNTSISVLADINSNGNQIIMSAGAGGIALGANVNAGAGALELATTGAITQTAGIITTGGLYLSAGTGATLTQGNSIALIQNAVVTNGDLDLTEAPGVTLNLTGSLSAGGIHGVNLLTDALVLVGDSNAYLTAGGSISIAPASAGRPIQLTSRYNLQTTGTLTLDPALFQSGTLRFGSATSGNIIVGETGGGSDTGIYLSSKNLVLTSAGTITQGSVLQALSLSASAAGITLANTANSIPTLGTITGIGAGAGVSIATSGYLDVTGPVTGGQVSLQAAGYALRLDTGGISATSGVTLIAASYISQTAAITAPRLDATAGGVVQLNNGGNQIGTLGNITSGLGFTGRSSQLSGGLLLTNGVPLNIVGTIAVRGTAGTSPLAAITNTGPISIAATGTIASTQVALNSTDAITETAGGALLAGTLSGGATSVALASTANSISNLGPFGVVTGGLGSFTLVDSAPLTISGNTLSVPTGGQIALTDDSIYLGSSTVPGGPFIVAPGGGVTLAPFTTTNGVEIVTTGTQNPAALSFRTYDIQRISTGTLTLGTPSGGPIHLGNLFTTVVGGGQTNFYFDPIDLRNVATHPEPAERRHHRPGRVARRRSRRQ